MIRCQSLCSLYYTSLLASFPDLPDPPNLNTDFNLFHLLVGGCGQILDSGTPSQRTGVLGPEFVMTHFAFGGD
jgi:hypothetical protein